MSIVGRAVESLFYNSAVAGTHRAMVAMGFIPADQPARPDPGHAGAAAGRGGEARRD